MKVKASVKKLLFSYLLSYKNLIYFNTSHPVLFLDKRNAKILRANMGICTLTQALGWQAYPPTSAARLAQKQARGSKDPTFSLIATSQHWWVQWKRAQEERLTGHCSQAACSSTASHQHHGPDQCVPSRLCCSRRATCLPFCEWGAETQRCRGTSTAPSLPATHCHAARTRATRSWLFQHLAPRNVAGTVRTQGRGVLSRWNYLHGLVVRRGKGRPNCWCKHTLRLCS